MFGWCWPGPAHPQSSPFALPSRLSSPQHPVCSLALFLFNRSGNETVGRVASCSNRGQAVGPCRLKAALMVSVKVSSWTPTAPLATPQQAQQRSKPARCVAAGPCGQGGRFLAGAPRWLCRATTCALLARGRPYLCEPHGLKRAFSVQTHSPAAGIPSARRN